MSDKPLAERDEVNLEVPDKVSDALADLTEKQAAAVRAYVTRTNPAYGNKAKALRQAGYADGTSTYKVFGKDHVREAMKAIREWQLEMSGTIIEEIRAVAPEAKDELTSQLQLGINLSIINPQRIFGEDLELENDLEADRLKEITKHNRAVAKLAKQRRKAAELLLAYAEGTPEQRVRMTKTQEKSDLEELLESLPEEEFRRIGKIIFGEGGWPEGDGAPESAPSTAEKDIVEADYTIEEDGQ